MRLKALMVKLIPDDKLILETRQFVPKDAVLLDLEKCVNSVDLEIENNEECFVTRSHFNPDNDFYYIPAFRIIELDHGDSSNNYKVKYSPIKGSNEREFFYDENFDVFYDTPAIKIRKKKWQYCNDIEKASSGSINAGSFYINIYNKKSDEKINMKPYRMYVLPSSISLEKYEIMINDLLNINRELILENNTLAKQSIQVTWTKAVEEVEKIVDSIKQPLLEINKEPKVKIAKESSKVSINSIKKFNSKTLIDIGINKGKFKVNGFEEIEDADIYENRMILYALESLNNHIKVFDDSLAEKVQIKKKKNLEEMQKILKLYNCHNYEELMNIIAKNEKDKFYDLVIGNCTSKIEDSNENNIEVKIPFNRLSDETEYRVFFAGGKLHSIVETGWNKELRSYSLGYNNGTYTIIGEQEKYITMQGKKFHFELITNDIKQHLLLYYCLVQEKYSFGDIHAKVKAFGNDDRDILRGKEVLTYGRPYIPPIYEYKIKATKLISIKDKGPNNFNERDLKKLFAMYGVILNREQIFEQMKMLKHKNENLITEEFKVNARSEKVKEISDKINKLKQLDVFRRVSKGIFSWKLTQIFSNDRNYRRVFNQLRNLDRKLEYSNSFNVIDIINKKTDKLYEYWMLVKMLYILTVEQKWCIQEGKSIKALINDLLKKNIELEDTCFKLTHNGIDRNKIKLNLYYNKQFENKKTPDFAFEVIVENFYGEEYKKWFYLDAKYRDYNEMGKYFLYKDINEVAIKKYINSFINTDTEASASFIAHTDNNDDFVYFGGFFNKELEEQLSEWTDDNPRHKFGAFFFIPNEIENFITFTKLMFEYHFMEQELWKICWDCGSVNIQIEEKSTYGGNKKFHLKCPNCSSFWVRNHCDSRGDELVKHAVNSYHKEEIEGDPWYVKCPECDYVKYNV